MARAAVPSPSPAPGPDAPRVRSAPPGPRWSRAPELCASLYRVGLGRRTLGLGEEQLVEPRISATGTDCPQDSTVRTAHHAGTFHLWCAELLPL